MGVLVFCAASRRLHARDTWIGWSEEQQRRRLALVVNNARFLLLPHKTVSNLASRTLRLALERLGMDWELRYGHPVVLVEAFVDPEHYCGTTYTVSGWQELGRTEGHGRVRRDFYTEHGKPTRLHVSHLNDLSRVRSPRSMLFMGMFRRLSNSLCVHWMIRQPRSHHKTTTDFFSAMNANHHRYAFRSLFAAHPSFSLAS